MQHFEIYLTLDLSLKFLEAVSNIVTYSIANDKIKMTQVIILKS